MNNTRFYKIIIVVLVILNLGTLIFLWSGRPGKGQDPKQSQAAAFLIRELSLTTTQQDEFGKFRELHRAKLLVLQENDRQLHDRFFEALFLPSPDSLEVKILADSIAGLRRQMEMLTFEHFMQLRQLLNEEQKEKFHRVFQQALEKVMPLPPPPPPMPPPPPPPN